MKVVFAIARFGEDGGTGRAAVALARILQDAGHEVHVICQESTSQVQEAVVHRIPVPGRGLARTLAFARRAPGVVRQLRCDVSVGFDRLPGLDIYRAGGGSHRAFLAATPGWWRSPRLHLEARLEAAAVARAAVVVANAPDPALDLERRYPQARGRVVVIPNGVDHERFCPDVAARREGRARLGLEAPVAIFLGSDFKRKGLETAIQAVAPLGATLVVVGGGSGGGRYQRLAHRLGVRLLLLGASSRPEEILPVADVMVLPTRYDSAANAVLEAMASGVPPITSGSNGARAFLPHPWMTVERHDDVEGFSGALRRALGEPGLPACCRERALGMGWEARAGAWEAAMERVRTARREKAVVT